MAREYRFELSRTSCLATKWSSSRSYSFFGAMYSEMPLRFRREEDRLLLAGAQNGLHIAAAWRNSSSPAAGENVRSDFRVALFIPDGVALRNFVLGRFLEELCARGMWISITTFRNTWPISMRPAPRSK